MSKVARVQELRRSNAAQPIPSKKQRRRRTRKARKSAAIQESRD